VAHTKALPLLIEHIFHIVDFVIMPENNAKSTAGESDDALPNTPPKNPRPAKKTPPPQKTPLPSLVISSSPHIVGPLNIERVMYMVVVALLPAAAAAVYFFGLPAFEILVTSVVFCVLFEAIFVRIFQPNTDWRRTAIDGSAIVTGILLAMNLPSTSPMWLVIVGAFVAMLLGKHVYGGLGQNPFNPALVARVFLLISFPQQMTHWIAARGDIVNAASYATPLGVLQIQGAQKAMALSKWGLFLGKCGGSLGETSVLALIIGGIILLAIRIIRWHIPVSYIGTVFVFSGILWLINPHKYADPLFHILSGGLMLGAIFMATDLVTSPITGRGMLIFGVGCGILTVIIRIFGSYPEGVSFSILIMNCFTPLIDRYVRGPRYGLRAVVLPQKA